MHILPCAMLNCLVLLISFYVLILHVLNIVYGNSVLCLAKWLDSRGARAFCVIYVPPWVHREMRGELWLFLLVLHMCGFVTTTGGGPSLTLMGFLCVCILVQSAGVSVSKYNSVLLGWLVREWFVRGYQTRVKRTEGFGHKLALHPDHVPHESFLSYRATHPQSLLAP